MTTKRYKNLQAFTDAKGIRPLLKGVLFSEDGNVYATNSHIAISLEGFNKTGTSFILDLKTMEQIEGTYPGIARLFPASGSIELRISLEDIKGMLLFLKGFKKQIVQLELKNKGLFLKVGDAEYKTEIATDETFLAHFSANYLAINLQVFADEKTDVAFMLTSPLRPSLLYNENIRTLITPIRKGDSE